MVPLDPDGIEAFLARMDAIPRWWGDESGIFTGVVTSDGTPGPRWPARLFAKGWQPIVPRKFFEAPAFEVTNNLTSALWIVTGRHLKEGARSLDGLRALSSNLGLKRVSREVICLLAESLTPADFKHLGIETIFADYGPGERTPTLCNTTWRMGQCQEILASRLLEVDPSTIGFVYLHDTDQAPASVDDQIAWLENLKAVKPPQDPALRAKLERKLAEYIARAAEGQDLSLHGLYKLRLLEHVLRADRPFDVNEVVTVILAERGIEGFEPIAFTSACGVILSYLGVPPPGTIQTGGTGL